MSSSHLIFADVFRGLEIIKEKGTIINSVVTSPPYFGLRSYFDENDPLKAIEIGNEETVDEYVDKLVRVFRSIREILAPDGTLFLNLGTSYAGSGGAGGDYNSGGSREGQRKYKSNLKPGQFKSKDMIPIPWYVGEALRVDGWYLRSDLIWHRQNARPEAVKDRPPRNHEYVLVFSKNRRYFFDEDAIRIHKGRPTGNIIRGRRRRTIWKAKVRPYKGAHFSTYPPKLIEPMILAGTSAWGHCPECGKAWKRIVQRGEPDEAYKKKCGADSQGEYLGKATKEYARAKAEDPSAVKARILAGMVIRRTVGWGPTCKCGIYTCKTCAVVIERKDNKVEVYHDGKRMEEESPNNQEMPNMRKGIRNRGLSKREKRVLQQAMCGQMDEQNQKRTSRSLHDDEGLRGALHAGASYGIESRLCNGASNRDGKSFRKKSVTDRSCTPQEQKESRQQTLQSGIEDQNGSRQGDKLGGKTTGNMPLLRKKLLKQGECSVCQGKLIFVPFKPVPGTVLDCFFGSGTTAQVAIAHGRKIVGIEMQRDYRDLIRERIEKGKAQRQRRDDFLFKVKT